MNTFSNIESEMSWTASKTSKCSARYIKEKSILITKEMIPLQLRITRRGAREQNKALHNVGDAPKRLSKGSYFKGNTPLSIMQISLNSCLR